MKSVEEIKKNFKEMDKLLFEVEKDFEKIEKISSELKLFSKKIKILEDFYFHKNWLKDRETLKKENQDKFYSATEDAIWNLSVAYREERIKLIKQLVEGL